MAASSTRLRLRVSPAARSAGIVGRHGDAWKVRVKTVRLDGVDPARVERAPIAAAGKGHR